MTSNPHKPGDRGNNFCHNCRTRVPTLFRYFPDYTTRVVEFCDFCGDSIPEFIKQDIEKLKIRID